MTNHDFLSLPPAEWEQWYQESTDSDIVEDEMAGILAPAAGGSQAQRATLAARYLEMRNLGYRHDEAVGYANRAVVKVRAALGFSYPERGTFGF